MKGDVIELVDLPDPAVQPLVHPLDLPEARGWFLRLWMIGLVTSPPIAFCAAALVWFATQSYLAPLIVGGVLIAVGALAGHYLSDCAWEYIPRRRQDRQRPLPVSWELGASLFFAVLLAAVLLLVAWRLGRPDVPDPVQAVIFGGGAAVAVLVAVEFAGKVLRRRGRERRTAWFSLPGVLVVIGCAAAAYALLFGPAGPTSVALVLSGVVAMLVMGGLAELARRAGLVH
jgi:hypothetical protein